MPHHYSLRLALFVLLIAATGSLRAEKLIFHEIKTDAKGHIIPWSHSEPAKAYDHILGLVWKFWRDIRTDQNGLPYYLNHQVWQRDRPDPRGIGSDQFQAGMESWRLYFMYSGTLAVKENQRFLADWYLARGMSSPDSAWPNIPYPYNTLVYSGIYDGDMVLGKGYTQPDKAGLFGLELLRLYQMTQGDRFPAQSGPQYLAAAIAIADTLAAKTKPGDADNSPLPYKVHAGTGVVGRFQDNDWHNTDQGPASYTTNWGPTIKLWTELARLKLGQAEKYLPAANLMLAWMKAYPMKTNKWGPYFEDIPGWTDTQINATAWVQFILENRALFPDWKRDCERILDWTYATLGYDGFAKYGVTLVHEQTVDRRPGNSHNTMQAAVELLLAKHAGESRYIDPSVRKMNWAVYSVDHDGTNQYFNGPVWLTDGYTDYVRHVINAMAAHPVLAPADRNHILHSSSVVQNVVYAGLPIPALRPHRNVAYGLVKHISDDATLMVAYTTFDTEGQEIIRTTKKPGKVYVEDVLVSEGGTGQSFKWEPLPEGGVVHLNRTAGRRVFIIE